MVFTELDACISAGLDPHEWFYGVRYSKEFKEMIVAYFDLKGAISLQVADAQYRKSLRK